MVRTDLLKPVTSGTGEPYSLISDDGKWTGIDAEMWDEIEKRTGWEVEVKQASFDAMWGELDTGRADVVANCLAVKEERTDKYNATIPYYGDSQCIIVNDDSDYKTSDDLKGKTVGCTNGQAAQTIIEDMAKEKGFTVKLYEDSAVGMNDLKLGRIDAYANTTTNVNAFTHNNTDAGYVLALSMPDGKNTYVDCLIKDKETGALYILEYQGSEDPYTVYKSVKVIQ